MTETEQTTGKVPIPAERTVADVVGTSRHEADTERAASGWIAGMYGEVRIDCPRCGEDVFVSKAAKIGDTWRCENCDAHGEIDETP